MLTVAGHIGPMLVFPKGYQQANVRPPKLTPEEEAQRRLLLCSVRSFEKRDLKPAETDDRSVPKLGGGGEQSENDSSTRQNSKSQKPGRPGGALGDLFSGGFKPNPGALRGARRGK